MSGYTPGPWVVYTADGSLGTVETADGAVVVAQAQQVSAKDQLSGSPERFANARLIAAAPDLLEALFALLPHVEHADSCGDMDAYNNADVPTCGCGLDSARERANAAISRATGEGQA